MSGSSDQESTGAVVRVKGLPPKATREEIVQFFEACGVTTKNVVLIAKEKRSAGEVGGAAPCMAPTQQLFSDSALSRN
jgi:hypothetical protein